MRKYFPAFLSIEGRPCIVVGGGVIAQRKAQTLLDAGAQVIIVSPTLTLALRRKVEKGEVRHLEREYQIGDCQGMYVLIAATDDMKLNRSIGIEASNAGSIVNVVDDPDYCDFIAPSVVRRGDITFAISTGGSSPALARWLRREVQAHFPSQYSKVGPVLNQVRRQVRSKRIQVSPTRWQEVLDKEISGILKTRSRKQAAQRLLTSLTKG